VRLGRPVVDPERPQLVHQPRQRAVAGDTERAADLDRAVEHPPGRLGDVGLGERGLVSGRGAAVERPGAAPDQQAAGFQVELRFGQQLLGHPQVAEPGAEGLARGGPVEGEVVGAAGGAEPAHAVGEARRRQAHLGEAEAFADGAQHGVVVDPAVVEDDFRVPAGEHPVGGLDQTLDPPAKVVGVDEEHRCSRICHRHADGERGALGAGDEPLASVDRPAASDSLGPGHQHRGIGAGTWRRLGHGEAGADLSRRQRLEVASALRVVGDDVEEVHVALVGGGAVHRRRSEQSVAGLLEDDRGAPHVEPVAAELGRQLRGEDARLLRPGLQLSPQVRFESVRGMVACLGRDRHLADEITHALGQIGDLRRHLEVDHRAVQPPSAKSVAPVT
jgi:hypothetical protein